MHRGCENTCSLIFRVQRRNQFSLWAGFCHWNMSRNPNPNTPFAGISLRGHHGSHQCHTTPARAGMGGARLPGPAPRETRTRLVVCPSPMDGSRAGAPKTRTRTPAGPAGQPCSLGGAGCFDRAIGPVRGGPVSPGRRLGARSCIRDQIQWGIA